MESDQKKRLSMDIPMELHRWLRVKSAQSGKTMREIVTEALLLYQRRVTAHPDLSGE